MKKLISKMFDLILWILKPKLIRVNSREEAEFWTTYMGGKPVRGSKKTT